MGQKRFPWGGDVVRKLRHKEHSMKQTPPRSTAYVVTFLVVTAAACWWRIGAWGQAPSTTPSVSATVSPTAPTPQPVLTPVVVPPAVAILGSGRLSRDVVATEGGVIEAHLRMPLSLTFDHRCVTGGEAARFMAALIRDLQKGS